MAPAVALAMACGFSAEGGGKPGLVPGEDAGDSAVGTVGGTDDTGVGPGESGVDSGSGVDTGGNDGVGSITSPSSGGEDDTGPSGEDEESDDDSSQGDVCSDPPFFKQVVNAEEAFLSDPMMLWTPPGDESFVATLQDDAGVASFFWDAPCGDDYWLWARVWDDMPGALDDGPDSFEVGLADGGSSTWLYGCQTATVFNGAWHWLKVQESFTCLFDEDVIQYHADAGPRVFTFEGLEGGTYNAADPPGELAAISRILITNDPDFVPGTDD